MSFGEPREADDSELTEEDVQINTPLRKVCCRFQRRFLFRFHRSVPNHSSAMVKSSQGRTMKLAAVGSAANWPTNRGSRWFSRASPESGALNFLQGPQRHGLEDTRGEGFRVRGKEVFCPRTGTLLGRAPTPSLPSRRASLCLESRRPGAPPNRGRPEDDLRGFLRSLRLPGNCHTSKSENRSSRTGSSQQAGLPAQRTPTHRPGRTRTVARILPDPGIFSLQRLRGSRKLTTLEQRR